MLKPYNAKECRLQLLRNGYPSLALTYKVPQTKNWPKAVIDEASIRHDGRMHSAKTVGVRLDDQIVLDFDIPEVQLSAEVEAEIKAMPGWPAGALIRRSNPYKGKFAVFLRAAEGTKFRRIATRRWKVNEADEEVHQVECFAGHKRQFGVIGEKAPDEFYEWDGPSLLDVKLEDLPIVDEKFCAEICRLVNKYFEKRGMIAMQVEGPEGAILYTLTDEMKFETDNLGTLTLDELDEAADADGEVRLNASFVDPTSTNTERCRASIGYDGLYVYDNQSGATYRRKDRSAEDVFNRFGAAIGNLSRPENSPLFAPRSFDHNPRPGIDDYAYARSWLDVNWHWQPSGASGHGCMLDGRHPEAEPVRLTGMRTMLASFSIPAPQRGNAAPRMLNPLDGWAAGRKSCVGGRMMVPIDWTLIDRKDGGWPWLNTYRAPRHPAEGGCVEPFEVFMAHLFPNEPERDWLLQSLASKLLRPWERGPAVVMVAREQGTGRGSLFDILARLMGDRYVETIPFSKLTGRDPGARFNEYKVRSLFICIDEANNPDDDSASVRGRSNIYEYIKTEIDPSSDRSSHIEAKGKTAIKSQTFCSYLIATNHADAIKIPEGDRRIAVLTNGDEKLDNGKAKALRAWMNDPANIGALDRWLREYPITTYCFNDEPPLFSGKLDMIEAGKTSFSRAFEEALEWLPGCVMTVPQLQSAVGRRLTNPSLHWQSMVATEAGRHRLLRPIRQHELRPMFEGYRGPFYIKGREKERQELIGRGIDVVKIELRKNAGKLGEDNQ